jgi:hypothetical protein
LRRIVALAFGVAIMATAAGSSTACTAGDSASANGANSATPPAVQAVLPPAAAAGGACQLLDWTMIKSSLGLTFAVAAAAQQGDTYTCVTQGRAASLPDLMLAVTATTVDASVYTSTVQPKGAVPVAGVGKVAFSLITPAAGVDRAAGVDQAVEVGWLAGNSRIIDLRLRLPKQATPDTLPKLVDLAKKVDLSSL